MRSQQGRFCLRPKIRPKSPVDQFWSLPSPLQFVSATLWPVRGDLSPRTDGSMDGSILLTRTLTVEQSICTIYIVSSFQSIGLSLLFTAAPVLFLYCSVLFSDILYSSIRTK